eukprot:51449-Eustigmatos_ZCMA.PRE.1
MWPAAFDRHFEDRPLSAHQHVGTVRVPVTCCMIGSASQAHMHSLIAINANFADTYGKALRTPGGVTLR